MPRFETGHIWLRHVLRRGRALWRALIHTDYDQWPPEDGSHIF